MVFAFFIQTLNTKNCDILYYRFYTAYDNALKKVLDEFSDRTSSRTENIRPSAKAAKIFETATEKKDLLDRLANRIQMHYYMKRQHSLVPSQYDNKDCIMKSFFAERYWKDETVNGLEMLVVWAAVPGLAFSLVCKRNENHVQAQNILHIIMNQLEKHLQFITNPVMPLTLVETVSLVVNRFLPAGQLLFLNSKLQKEFEKQLESDLFSK